MSIPPTSSIMNGIVQPQGDTLIITTTGSPLSIPLTGPYTSIKLYNNTAYGTSPGTPAMIEAYWNNYMAQGTALILENVSSTAAVQSVVATSGGISLYNQAAPPIFPVQTNGTTITAANPAVASIPTASTNFSNGQTVRLTNVVGAPQLNGFLFTISNVTGTSFTIPYLDASGFAAGATSFHAQVVYPLSQITFPANNLITKIITGLTTTIQLAVTHNYFVGLAPGGGSGQVDLTIPAEYGAQGLNRQEYGNPNPWTITAINTVLPNSITINANSSGVLPFAFPTAAVWSTNKPTPPQTTPFGQTPYNYQNASLFNPQWILGLGANVCGTGAGTISAELKGAGIITTYPPQIPS